MKYCKECEYLVGIFFKKCQCPSNYIKLGILGNKRKYLKSYKELNKNNDCKYFKNKRYPVD